MKKNLLQLKPTKMKKNKLFWCTLKGLQSYSELTWFTNEQRLNVPVWMVTWKEKRSLTHQAAAQLPNQHGADLLVSAVRRHLNRHYPLTPWHRHPLSTCLSVVLSVPLYAHSVPTCQTVFQSASDRLCVWLMCFWNKVGHWAVQL